MCIYYTEVCTEVYNTCHWASGSVLQETVVHCILFEVPFGAACQGVVKVFFFSVSPLRGIGGKCRSAHFPVLYPNKCTTGMNSATGRGHRLISKLFSEG